MVVGIYIKGTRREFSFDIGWFSGNEWSLFKLNILEFYDPNATTIFYLQILKFVISLELDKV